MNHLEITIMAVAAGLLAGNVIKAITHQKPIPLWQLAMAALLLVVAFSNEPDPSPRVEAQHDFLQAARNLSGCLSAAGVGSGIAGMRTVPESCVRHIKVFSDECAKVHDPQDCNNRVTLALDAPYVSQEDMPVLEGR